MKRIATRLDELVAHSDVDGEQGVWRLTAQAARAVAEGNRIGVLQLPLSGAGDAGANPTSMKQPLEILRLTVVTLGKRQDLPDTSFFSLWLSLFEYLAHVFPTRLAGRGGRKLGPGMRRIIEGSDASADPGLAESGGESPALLLKAASDGNIWNKESSDLTQWAYYATDWKERARDYADACRLLAECAEPSQSGNLSQNGTAETAASSSRDRNHETVNRLENQLFAMIGPEGIEMAKIISNKELSADDKMDRMLKLDGRFAGNGSEEWGKILGVSSAAIRRTATWKRLRGELMEERQAKAEVFEDRAGLTERQDVHARRRPRK